MVLPDFGPNGALFVVVAVLLLIFLHSVFARFLSAVTNKSAHVHVGGGFVAGLYLGYDVDPDAMIVQELVGTTTEISSEIAGQILFVFWTLSVIEIVVGGMFVAEKRGRWGLLGALIIAVSGYLFPILPEIAISMFLFGALVFAYSEDHGF
jgi:hypothetical protein